MSNEIIKSLGNTQIVRNVMIKLCLRGNYPYNYTHKVKENNLCKFYVYI